jgi:hypothetical protein
MVGGEAADAVALRRLVDCYGMTVDAGDGAGFIELFEEDAVLQVYYGPESAGPPVETRGRDRLAAIPSRLSGRFDRTFHFVGNHVCTVEGDTATGETYCLAHHVNDGPMGGTDYVMVIRYDDSYRRGEDGTWRFRLRRVLTQWTETRSINPVPSGGGTRKAST